jgi:hypothetical protein
LRKFFASGLNSARKCLDVAAIVGGAELADYVLGRARRCGVVLLRCRDVPQVLDQSIANAIDRQHVARRRPVRVREFELRRDQIAGGNTVEQVDARQWPACQHLAEVRFALVLRAHPVGQLSRQTIRIVRDLEDSRVRGKQRQQRCGVAVVQCLHVGANDRLRIDTRGGDAREVHADGLGRLARRHRLPLLHVMPGVAVAPRGGMEVMRMRVEIVRVA